MIILGVDPGTATTGYGVIKTQKRKGKKQKSLKCLDYGTIKTDAGQTMPRRLKKLNNLLSKLIKKYHPEVLAVENVFFFKNLKTVMTVSQAKGVILLTAAKNKIPVSEFSPLEVKLNVSGFGRAEKKTIQKKIKKLLHLKKLPKSDDAADALAIALTYSIKKL